MDNKTRIEIPTLTILKIVGIILGLWFLWRIRDIIVLLFVVAILVAALYPIVDRLSQRKIPRFFSVLLIYLILASFFALLIYLIVPPIVFQVKEFTYNLPVYIERYSPYYEQLKEYLPVFQQQLENIAGSLNKLTTNVLVAATAIFGGLVSFLTVLVLTFYILLEKKGLKEALTLLLPPNRRTRFIYIVKQVAQKMGSWLRGQLLLCLIIGVGSLIILTILKVPYALILAVLAGILEIIPSIGPILAAIPAIFLGLTVSPLTAFIVLICYVGLQQLENHILVPKIMGRIVGLSPVIIIIALLIGAKLFGILGAILAVPTAAALVVLIKEYRSS